MQPALDYILCLPCRQLADDMLVILLRRWLDIECNAEC